MKKKFSLLSFPMISHWPAAVVIGGGLSLLFSSVGHAQEVWDGGGGDNNFGTGDNWVDGTAPAVGSGTVLHFTGGTNTTPNNNYATGDNFGEWWLLSGATAPFTISGNGFGLFNKIENSSSQLFTINTAGIYARDGSMEINPVGGNITIGSGTSIELDGNTTLDVYDGNNSRTLTINGTLSNGNGTGGNGALRLNQTATVILTGTNDYGGTVLNNSSKLRVGAGGTTGTLGVGNVTLNNTSSLIFDRSNAITVANAISGAGSVTKLGADTLILQGSNSFSGGMTIKAGTVFINTATGVNGLGSGKVTIGDVANTGASAELLFSATTGNFPAFSNQIDVVGNGASTLRVTGYNPTFSGAVTLSNNLNIVSNNPFGSTIGFSGGVTGTGNLVIQSNAANGGANSAITFSGATVNMTGSITNSGTTTSTTASNTTISAVIGTNVTGITQNSTNSQLILTGNNTFTSNILISSGTLQANRTSASSNPISGALGNTQALGRTATINSGGTLRFVVADVMGDGGSSPKLTLIANGGTILNGGNFINSLGPVQLNGGTLNSSGTGTGFKLTGTVTVGGSVASTISSGGNIASNSIITYDVADAVSGSGSDLNVTAVLADVFGTGGVIKTGVGTMTLSNQNTFTGGTRIDNGTLALGHATNTLANAGAVNVNGGTLALGTNTDTVGAVTLTSGSITGTGAGTLTGTGSAYDVRSGSVSAKLGGSVGLTKTTAGTVTLSGVNAYSGATAVNGGRLTIDTSGSINTSSGVTIAGGTLRYNASTSLATTVTFTSGTLEGTNWNGNLSGLTIGSGQTISPGNSPGTATTGSQTWAGAGSYLFEINNATGGAGADPGWDLLNGSGTLNISATSGSPFNILLTSLTLGNIAGDAANFSDATSYNWLFADFVNPITGYAADRFFVNTTAFDNAFTGTFGVALGNTIGGGDNTQLYLTYTPVPEPRAALLGGLGMLMLLRRRRS